MDLVDALRRKIETLENGDYTPGLKAVLLHIETAFGHLARGQKDDSETAFTDAIYRTNQVFEGSIKEAYRVLTEKDPGKISPAEIESYLEQKGLLRERVLAQLTTYRKGWRNPSTHDYKLDFDESEAFLAIISVSALACLLLDLIAEQLAFRRSQLEADASRSAIAANLALSGGGDLHSRVTALLMEFCASHFPASTASSKMTELQIIGALHGFLSSAAPDLSVSTEPQINSKGALLMPDLLVSKDSEVVIVELKRRATMASYVTGLAQMQIYLSAADAKSGILLILPEPVEDMRAAEATSSSSDDKGLITVLAPARVHSRINAAISLPQDSP